MRPLSQLKVRPVLTQVALELAMAYSNIIFLSDPRMGFLVFVLTFARFNVGLCALTSGLISTLFVRTLNFRSPVPSFQIPLVNSILVGLVFGTLAQFDPIALILISLFSIGTTCLTLALQSVFGPLGIPVFSLPFSLISMLLSVIIPHSANLFLLRPGFEPLPAFELPDPSGHFSLLVSGFGNILGAQSTWVGLAILALLFIRSRFAFLSALLGLGVGWALEDLRMVSNAHLWHSPLAYNEALAAVAMGSVFFVPSSRSLFLSLIASALTVLYGDALRAATGGASVYTLPFFLSVGTLLITLRSLGDPRLIENPELPAEKNLERHLSTTRRFSLNKIQLGNPLLGTWRISQGNNGKHTHKEPWNHALDFVQCDESGKTYKNQGTVLTDYYGFDRPVFSPVNGTVVEVVSNRPDCLAGSTDTVFPWGNYIIIRTLDLYYVVLAHLRCDSATVVSGQYVAEGSVLGAVGNSGYSPEPHLHLHVQTLPSLGSPTLEFLLVGYLSENIAVFSNSPIEGQSIDLLSPDLQIEKWVNFPLGSSLLIEEADSPMLRLRVEMEPKSGFFYFEDPDRNRLHFSKNRNYFCLFGYEGRKGSFLEALHAALPRIPLAARPGTTWEDPLPISISHSWLEGAFAYLQAAWFFPPRPRVAHLKMDEAGMSVKGSTILSGQRVRVAIHFDPLRGLSEIRVGKKTYWVK